MRKETTGTIQVLRAVRARLVEQPIEAPVGSIPTQVTELGKVVDNLATLTREQAGATRAYYAGCAEAKQRATILREQWMKPVSQLGLTLFPGDPVMQRALSMPKQKGFELLVAEARSMADHAEQHKAAFVAAGFDSGFAAGMLKAVDALQEALDQRRAHRARRKDAVGRVQAESARGRRIVRLIDTMVAPLLRGDPDKLEAWEALTRMPKARSGEEANGEDEVPAEPTPVEVPTVPAPTRAAA